MICHWCFKQWYRSGSNDPKTSNLVIFAQWEDAETQHPSLKMWMDSTACSLSSSCWYNQRTNMLSEVWQDKIIHFITHTQVMTVIRWSDATSKVSKVLFRQLFYNFYNKHVGKQDREVRTSTVGTTTSQGSFAFKAHRLSASFFVQVQATCFRLD